MPDNSDLGDPVWVDVSTKGGYMARLIPSTVTRDEATCVEMVQVQWDSTKEREYVPLSKVSELIRPPPAATSTGTGGRGGAPLKNTRLRLQAPATNVQSSIRMSKWKGDEGKRDGEETLARAEGDNSKVPSKPSAAVQQQQQPRLPPLLSSAPAAGLADHKKIKQVAKKTILADAATASARQMHTVAKQQQRGLRRQIGSHCRKGPTPGQFKRARLFSPRARSSPTLQSSDGSSSSSSEIQPKLSNSKPPPSAQHEVIDLVDSSTEEEKDDDQEQRQGMISASPPSKKRKMLTTAGNIARRDQEIIDINDDDGEYDGTAGFASNIAGGGGDDEDGRYRPSRSNTTQQVRTARPSQPKQNQELSSPAAAAVTVVQSKSAPGKTTNQQNTGTTKHQNTGKPNQRWTPRAVLGTKAYYFCGYSWFFGRYRDRYPTLLQFVPKGNKYESVYCYESQVVLLPSEGER
jgi:hypothetical protein